MNPGNKSQPNHSDKSTVQRMVLFSFPIDSELAQGRGEMKKVPDEP
jgi:hypothetical protein